MKAFCMAWIFLGLAVAGRADERLFSYTEQAELLPKGGLEFEQWLTNRNGKAGMVYSRFDLREELEYGITDRLSGALYLNTKSQYSSAYDSTLDADVNTEEFSFEGLSFELKYGLLSPLTHWLGALAYGELSYNGPEFEAEGKLVLEHRIGESLVMAANFTVANEYAYEASKEGIEGESEFNLGISWKLSPAAALGLELRNHRVWPDNWGWQESSAWFAGPSVHLGGEKAWATLTVLPQLSGQPESIGGDGRDLNGHEKLETRLLVGVNF